MQMPVCTGAKNISLCVQYVLVLRLKASGSPLEKRAAPQSASLFIITVYNKAWIMQTAGAQLISQGSCFLIYRGQRFQKHKYIFVGFFTYGVQIFMSTVHKVQQQKQQIHAKRTNTSWSWKPHSSCSRKSPRLSHKITVCLSLWPRECKWRFFLWTLGMFSGTTDPKIYLQSIEGAGSPWKMSCAHKYLLSPVMW